MNAGVHLEELHQELQAADGGRRIVLLNQIARETMAVDAKRGAELAQEAVLLARKMINEGESGGAQGMTTALMLKAICQNKQGHTSEALETLDEAMVQFAEMDDREGEAGALNNFGNVYLSIGDYPRALEHYLRSLAIKTELGKRHAGTLRNIGIVYQHLGDYSNALDHHVSSCELLRENGDRRGEARALISVGHVYELLDNHGAALEHYYNAYEIIREADLLDEEARVLGNIGSIHAKGRRYDEALQFFQRSLAIKRRVGDVHSQANLLLNIGLVYVHRGELDRALPQFGQSLAIKRRTGNRLGEAEALHALGVLNGRRDFSGYDPKLALEQLQQALDIAEKLQAKRLVYDVKHSLAELYEQRGEFEQALAEYRSFHLLKEELHGSDRDKKLRDLQTVHQVESARKEAEIYRLRNVELASLNEDLRREKSRADMLNAHLQDVNSNLEKIVNEKNEFLGIVAHDLRNPLANIVLSASMVNNYRGRMTSADIGREMDKIELTATHLKDIVANLLDLNKLDSGARAMEQSQIDVHKLMLTLVTLHRDRAAVKHIRLDYEPGDIRHAVARADKQAFQQSIENIISNAIKYSPPGKRVSIRLSRSEPAPGEARYNIHVRDEGPGIPADERQRLFEKFARLSSKPTGGEHSVGLGLYITKRLMNEMRGDVSFLAPSGGGAEFVLSIPAC